MGKLDASKSSQLGSSSTGVVEVVNSESVGPCLLLDNVLVFINGKNNTDVETGQVFAIKSKGIVKLGIGEPVNFMTGIRDELLLFSQDKLFRGKIDSTNLQDTFMNYSISYRAFCTLSASSTTSTVHSLPFPVNWPSELMSSRLETTYQLDTIRLNYSLETMNAKNNRSNSRQGTGLVNSTFLGQQNDSGYISHSTIMSQSHLQQSVQSPGSGPSKNATGAMLLTGLGLGIRSPSAIYETNVSSRQQTTLTETRRTPPHLRVNSNTGRRVMNLDDTHQMSPLQNDKTADSSRRPEYFQDRLMNEMRRIETRFHGMDAPGTPGSSAIQTSMQTNQPRLGSGVNHNISTSRDNPKINLNDSKDKPTQRSRGGSMSEVTKKTIGQSQASSKTKNSQIPQPSDNFGLIDGADKKSYQQPVAHQSIRKQIDTIMDVWQDSKPSSAVASKQKNSRLDNIRGLLHGNDQTHGPSLTTSPVLLAASSPKNTVSFQEISTGHPSILTNKTSQLQESIQFLTKRSLPQATLYQADLNIENQAEKRLLEVTGDKQSLHAHIQPAKSDKLANIRGYLNNMNVVPSDLVSNKETVEYELSDGSDDEIVVNDHIKYEEMSKEQTDRVMLKHPEEHISPKEESEVKSVVSRTKTQNNSMNQTTKSNRQTEEVNISNSISQSKLQPNSLRAFLSLLEQKLTLLFTIKRRSQWRYFFSKLKSLLKQVAEDTIRELSDRHRNECIQVVKHCLSAGRWALAMDEFEHVLKSNFRKEPLRAGWTAIWAESASRLEQQTLEAELVQRTKRLDEHQQRKLLLITKTILQQKLYILYHEFFGAFRRTGEDRRKKLLLFLNKMNACKVRNDQLQTYKAMTRIAQFVRLGGMLMAFEKHMVRVYMNYLVLFNQERSFLACTASEITMRDDSMEIGRSKHEKYKFHLGNKFMGSNLSGQDPSSNTNNLQSYRRSKDQHNTLEEIRHELSGMQHVKRLEEFSGFSRRSDRSRHVAQDRDKSPEERYPAQANSSRQLFSNEKLQKLADRLSEDPNYSNDKRNRPRTSDPASRTSRDSSSARLEERPEMGERVLSLNLLTKKLPEAAMLAEVRQVDDEEAPETQRDQKEFGLGQGLVNFDTFKKKIFASESDNQGALSPNLEGEVLQKDYQTYYETDLDEDVRLDHVRPHDLLKPKSNNRKLYQEEEVLNRLVETNANGNENGPSFKLNPHPKLTDRSGLEAETQVEKMQANLNELERIYRQHRLETELSDERQKLTEPSESDLLWADKKFDQGFNFLQMKSGVTTSKVFMNKQATENVPSEQKTVYKLSSMKEVLGQRLNKLENESSFQAYGRPGGNSKGDSVERTVSFSKSKSPSFNLPDKSGSGIAQEDSVKEKTVPLGYTKTQESFKNFFKKIDKEKRSQQEALDAEASVRLTSIVRTQAPIIEEVSPPPATSSAPKRHGGLQEKVEEAGLRVNQLHEYAVSRPLSSTNPSRKLGSPSILHPTPGLPTRSNASSLIERLQQHIGKPASSSHVGNDRGKSTHALKSSGMLGNSSKDNSESYTLAKSGLGKPNNVGSGKKGSWSGSIPRNSSANKNSRDLSEDQHTSKPTIKLIQKDKSQLSPSSNNYKQAAPVSSRIRNPKGSTERLKHPPKPQATGRSSSGLHPQAGDSDSKHYQSNNKTNPMNNSMKSVRTQSANSDQSRKALDNTNQDYMMRYQSATSGGRAKGSYVKIADAKRVYTDLD